MEVTIQRYYAEGRLVADKRGGLVSYADLAILEAQINTLQKLNNGASEEVRSSRGRISELEAEIAMLRANNMGVKYDPQQPKPAVIHVVTPESSSGKLWAEIQRLQAVEAESARTIAHLNQTHREVSEMQKARIEELEKALRRSPCTCNVEGTFVCARCTSLELTETKPMTTESAQSNEERVREVWRNVCNEVTQLHEGHWPPTANEWAAARRFTEAALEEVRQLKAEIEWADREVAVAWTRDLHASSRILARLQSLLAEKSAGMKPEAL